MSKPPTCEQLAKSGTEHGHQVAVMHWANINANKWPELCWLYAVPNGGTRGDSGDMAARRGAALKAEGVKAGVLDLALDVARGPYHGLKIEMKKLFDLSKPSINYASKEQKEYIDFVIKQGYCAGVCQGWQQAVGVLEWYLELDQNK